MKTKVWLAASLLFFTIDVHSVPAGVGREDGVDIACIVKILGLGSEEELSEDTLQHFEDLSTHPLKLNSASGLSLRSSGLFSPFQIAVLLDYRSRHGDILSFMELTTLDGFMPEYVAALRPFVSLESRNGIERGGARRKLDGEVAARYGLKDKDGDKTLGGDLRAGVVAAGGALEMNLASAPAGNISWTLPSGRLRIVAGDYRCRFAQGLLVYQGFTMSSLRSVSSLSRRSSGVSLCHGFSRSSSSRGLVLEGEMPGGRLGGDLCLDASSGRVMLHSEYLAGHRLSLGLGAIAGWKKKDGALSIDARAAFGRLMFYGEAAAHPERIDAVGGFRWRTASGKFNSGGLLRMMDGKGEAALVGEFSLGKSVQKWGTSDLFSRSPRISETISIHYQYGKKLETCLLGNFALSPTTRFRLDVIAQLKPPYPSRKINTKAELKWDRKPFLLSSGAYSVLFDSKSLGEWTDGLCLWSEAGVSIDGLRLGKINLGDVFMAVKTAWWKTDGWNERLYLYLRTAPGGFSVPALSGEGLLLSGYACYKPVGRLKIYFEARSLSYRDHRLRSELRLSASYSF